METQLDVFKAHTPQFSWDNFLTPTPCDTSKLIHAELAHYERLGMEEPARQMHLRLMALAAEQKKMLLLSVKVWSWRFFGLKPLGDGKPTVTIVKSSGHGMYQGEMHSTPIAKYKERVPMSILDKLPTNTGKARVFWESRDPIIAVPICRRKNRYYFLGVFKW